jgi:Ca-activated chloride channel family protein
MKTHTHKLKTLTLSILIGLAAGCSSERADQTAAGATSQTTEADATQEIVAEGHEHEIQPSTLHRKVEEKHIGYDSSHYPTPAAAPIRVDGFRVAREELYREQYQHPDDNQTLRVGEFPVSTFSIDVETGAYSNMRRWVNQGSLPPQDAVRVEELINYFDYDYKPPEHTDRPFSVKTEIGATPWNPDTHLLRIGIQGYDVPAAELPASNLVFLVDVSGSMQSQDKLPLLKQALSLLTRKLDADDTISIVVYAGASGVVLDSAGGDRNATIISALEQLEAGGSTNGAAGIRLAYSLARQNFKENGVNRVILATDGDFNVGIANTEELIDLVERQRHSGIALTTLGFGSGNYNDHMLEQLADAGNGNHAYIDKLSEAQKVLSDELSATLLTIAKDVKIQVEFNPNTVSEYRLIGYENRALNEEDFNNDQVDAGEIGAGHSVTALYEINLVGSGFQRLPERRYGLQETSQQQTSAHADELAQLRIRYKLPAEKSSRLIETAILSGEVNQQPGTESPDFRFAAAVAAFGQKLRGGEYLGTLCWDDIRKLASQARGSDPFGYRGEFLQLVSLAGSHDSLGACRRAVTKN